MGMGMGSTCFVGVVPSSQSSSWLLLRLRNPIPTPLLMRVRFPLHEYHTTPHYLPSLSNNPTLSNFLTFASTGDEVVQMQNRTNKSLARVPPSNLFLSFIHAITTLGLSIIGALYALTHRDKIALDSKIQYLTTELKEKEALICFMEKNYESELLKEREERNMELMKAKEEQILLMSRFITSANASIGQLGHALQNEKAKFEVLELQLDSVQAKMTMTKNDKLSLEKKANEKDNFVARLQERTNMLSCKVKEKEEAVETMSFSLARKDLDLKSFAAEYDESSDELDKMKLENADFKKQLQDFRDELDEKTAVVDDTSTRIHSLVTERNELKFSCNSLLNKHDELRSSCAEKAAFDAKVLEEKESKKNEVSEKCKVAMSQAYMFKAEAESLSKDSYSQLESDILKAEAESRALATELGSVKESLDRTKGELLSMKRELAASAESRNDLQKELVEVYEKDEVASLNGKMMRLEEQIRKEKESRGRLETELKETTKALNEISKCARLLTQELEMERTNISYLHDEKALLIKCVDEEKVSSKEVTDRVVEGREVIMRLGRERERLWRKGKYLEKELSYSKSDMLKLKATLRGQQQST